MVVPVLKWHHLNEDMRHALLFMAIVDVKSVYSYLEFHSSHVTAVINICMYISSYWFLSMPSVAIETMQGPSHWWRWHAIIPHYLISSSHGAGSFFRITYSHIMLILIPFHIIIIVLIRYYVNYSGICLASPFAMSTKSKSQIYIYFARKYGWHCIMASVFVRFFGSGERGDKSAAQHASNHIRFMSNDIISLINRECNGGYGIDLHTIDKEHKFVRSGEAHRILHHTQHFIGKLLLCAAFSIAIEYSILT